MADFFRKLVIAYQIMRNLVAYTISVFVLFGVPLLFLSFMEMKQVIIVWVLWYVWLFVLMRPVWYVSWANAALLLNDVLVIYERITGRRVSWR